MSSRDQFEKIWPVPEGIAWSMNIGRYVCNDAIRITQELINRCVEWDIRLDTFARCQQGIFDKEEINLFRQWFNSMEDCNPKYIEQPDRVLYAKVMEALKWRS